MLYKYYQQGIDDSLVKLAKKDKDKHQLKSHVGGLAASLGMGGLGLGASGLALSGHTPIISDVSGPGEPTGFQRPQNAERMQELINQKAQQMGVKGPTEYHWLESPGYQYDKGYVRGPHNMSESILAHELGHAVNHRNIPGMSKLRTFADTAGDYTGAGAALYSLGAATPSYIPALAHLAITSPTLVDEVLASGRAIGNLSKVHGGLLKGLAKGKHLLPAFGSYAAGALAPLAITGVRHLLQDDK